eukprot:scaffold3732_cov147-Amphora_coffeaeformis.AAC.6
MARAAPTPLVGVTKDGLVVDEEFGQANVGVHGIGPWPTVVADEFRVGVARRKTRRVARTHRTVVVATFVRFGKVAIKDASLDLTGLLCKQASKRPSEQHVVLVSRFN